MNSSSTANMSPVIATGQTTTLGAAITTTNGVSLTTSVNFSVMPSTPFYIMIDNEQMSVTAVAGTTWTITRGDAGTTAATHLINATITQMQFRWKNFLSGNYFVQANNQVIIDTTNTGLVNTAEYWTGLYTPLPATSGYTITACLALYMPAATNYVSAGLGIIDSANGKYVGLPCVFYNSTYGWLAPSAAYVPAAQFSGSGYATALTSQTSSFAITLNQVGSGPPTPSNPLWLRIVDDTTNLNFYYSYDGNYFVKVGYAPRLSYLTTPSDYGIYISPRGGRVGVQCMALSVTTP